MRKEIANLALKIRNLKLNSSWNKKDSEWICVAEKNKKEYDVKVTFFKDTFLVTNVEVTLK